MTDDLRSLVEDELSQPVDPRVSAMAEAIAARHGAASRAVLFYGSCLREKQLDGLMLDFYLIVSDYASAYDRAWLAKANALIPPNVFPFQHDDLAAKYAVLSEADFRRECSVNARSVSVWARFSQPSRLVWASDDDAQETAVNAVSSAAPTLFSFTRPAMTGDERNDPLAVFKYGFGLTYGAEIRAERTARSSSIVDSDEARYSSIGSAVLGELPPLPKPPKDPKEAYKSGFQEGAIRVRSRQRAQRQWRRMQLKGKVLSVLRLAKASATYAGGAEYIAWKINRHAGTAIELKPWQKRHPLLAAISLLPRLLRSGAIR
jgi:hypothetical protein